MPVEVGVRVVLHQALLEVLVEVGLVAAILRPTQQREQLIEVAAVAAQGIMGILLVLGIVADPVVQVLSLFAMLVLNVAQVGP